MHKALTQTLLAAFCAIPFALRSLGEGWMAHTSLEGGGVMLIGARNGMLVGGWKNPYVTDGLINLWDGMTGLYDIIENVKLSTYGQVSVSKNGFVCNGGLYNADYNGISESINNNGASTVQVVGRFNAKTDFIFLVFFGNSYSPGTEDTNSRKRFCLYSADSSYIKWGFAQKRSNTLGFVNVSNLSSQAFSLTFIVNGSIATIINSVNSRSTIINISGTDPLTSGLYFFTPERGERYANGVMYSMRCYNRALGNAEIAANYAVDRARFNLP